MGKEIKVNGVTHVIINSLFPLFIPLQFPAASKASVFTQHTEGWKLERRLLLMQFYVLKKNGKEVKMRVGLPSWLGNSGCWDILSLCILTYLLHCFSMDQSPETNYCT